MHIFGLVILVIIGLRLITIGRAQQRAARRHAEYEARMYYQLSDACTRLADQLEAHEASLLPIVPSAPAPLNFVKPAPKLGRLVLSLLGAAVAAAVVLTVINRPTKHDADYPDQLRAINFCVLHLRPGSGDAALLLCMRHQGFTYDTTCEAGPQSVDHPKCYYQGDTK